MECRLGRTRAEKVARSSYPLSLVKLALQISRFRTAKEPLTARTDLSYEGEGKGILQPSSHLPTKNPEEPKRLGTTSQSSIRD